jgi:hypothetical protein
VRRRTCPHCAVVVRSYPQRYRSTRIELGSVTWFYSLLFRQKPDTLECSDIAAWS